MLIRSVLRRLIAASSSSGTCSARLSAPRRLLCSATPPSVPPPATDVSTHPGDVPAAVGDIAAPNLDEVAAGLKLDSEGKQKLHLLMLEYSELQLSGSRVPDRLSLDNWYELMLLKSHHGRRKYHAFLFKKEKKKLSDMLERQRKNNEYLEREKQLDEAALSGEPQHIRYGLGHNVCFERFTNSKLQSMRDLRLYQAMQFGQPLVFDMTYEADMNRRENKNTASQLLGAFSRNRYALDPFDLHFCNWNPSGEIWHFLQRFIPTVGEPSFPLQVHQQDFLELYPRERVVYLTPHCREELQIFDRDTVYVVGALVDLGDNKPLSLARAKKENLKMARLPITKYLSVGPSFRPSLTLTAIISILLELRTSGCWHRALEHVPRRSLQTPEQVAEIAARRSLKRTQELAWAQKRQQRWDRQTSVGSSLYEGQDPGHEPIADPFLERRGGRPPRRPETGSQRSPQRGRPAGDRVSSRLSEVLSDWTTDVPAEEAGGRRTQRDSAAGDGRGLRRGVGEESEQRWGSRMADGELFRPRSAQRRSGEESGPAGD